jgi:hypothetical protein
MADAGLEVVVRTQMIRSTVARLYAIYSTEKVCASYDIVMSRVIIVPTDCVWLLTDQQLDAAQPPDSSTLRWIGSNRCDGPVARGPRSVRLR